MSLYSCGRATNYTAFTLQTLNENSLRETVVNRHVFFYETIIKCSEIAKISAGMLFHICFVSEWHSGAFWLASTPGYATYYANLLVKHPQAVVSSRYLPLCPAALLSICISGWSSCFGSLLLFKLVIFHFKQSIFICSRFVFRSIAAPSVKLLSLLSYLFTGHAIYSLTQWVFLFFFLLSLCCCCFGRAPNRH